MRGIIVINYSLNNVSAHLLDLLDVKVAPHGDGTESTDQEADTRDKHDALRITIGTLNANALGTADLVAKLLVDIAVDGVDRGASRGVLCNILSESTGPDGSSNGVTNGGPDAAEKVQDSHDDGDVGVIGGTEHSHLSADDSGSSSKRDCDEC